MAAPTLLKPTASQLFQPFSKLPGSLVPTSLQVMKFSGVYVHIDDDKKWFDWASFKSAVDNYSGDDLAIDKFKSTTISRSESTVTVMVEKIVNFLRDALAIIIDPKELAATIEATFTNLKEAKSNGWADFSKESSQNNSSWEYRILFAVPNPDLDEWFYSLVTTIKLTADIQEESSWWGLVSSSSKNFSATVDAMELVVQKGFKNPKA
ncbi:delta-endotoxin CytB [Cylindrobasidium torrendii FP15055 ss-10]|uniref:Delta-endotoxin CytB n=1 Tax=Cylindrobasidium torrendii FP15055 ss-10 TaxID=1314674 RepID=A0A0D7AUU1_9AGAR|nr:delta-endotoxin CytB [Cylindrobasidium torrendii FP15055 ss-10]